MKPDPRPVSKTKASMLTRFSYVIFLLFVTLMVLGIVKFPLADVESKVKEEQSKKGKQFNTYFIPFLMSFFHSYI